MEAANWEAMMLKAVIVALAVLVSTPAWSFSEIDLAKFKALMICENCDLSDVDLSNSDLSRAKLHKANLSGADLFKAKLYGAHLNGANLSGANLSGADLSGADLGAANLSGSDMNGADLNRHCPDDLQVCGDHTPVPPPRELYPLCSHPMA